eukprot:TRINITY_DN6849_c1_g1_i4.p1 TRINITY_DN6849_c1_g1~~TRINITY_DN6849_c1_g1_i4.p1  ORF type:complete len:176 (+),score=60.69 TRINITY_DN6849_c1_g1_i4:210-737(+)
MKPAWDKLIDEFKGSSTSLVADVDCTAAGQSLCQKVGVNGYPTIKYGDPSDLQDYKGGRDFESLQKFAQENLGPTCGIDHIDLCSDEDKALIEKFQAMSLEELDAAIKEVDDKAAKIEAKAEKEVAKLNGKIKDLEAKLQKETDKAAKESAAVSKKLGLRIMRAVASAKKKKEEL